MDPLRNANVGCKKSYTISDNVTFINKKTYKYILSIIIIAKHYAKNHILSRDIVEAHEKGEIHFHDLDYSPFFPMFNCMLVDLKGMLENGFKMGNADIETPKSINTATAITAQIIAQVASHTYGGTTINRIDEILKPYVTKSYNKIRMYSIILYATIAFFLS